MPKMFSNDRKITHFYENLLIKNLGKDKELLLKLTVQTSLTHFSFSEHSASLIHGIGGGATNAEVKTKNIIPKKIVLFIIDVILCISC